MSSTRRFRDLPDIERRQRERTYVEESLKAIIAFAAEQGMDVTVDANGITVRSKFSFDTIPSQQ